MESVRCPYSVDCLMRWAPGFKSLGLAELRWSYKGSLGPPLDWCWECVPLLWCSGWMARASWFLVCGPAGSGTDRLRYSPEAVWDWLERNDGTGTPESLHGESSGRPRRTAEVRTAACRSTRRHRTDCGNRVIVPPDGTLSLERRRQEHEEAKLLVQTVTSEASSLSGSPCVMGRLSPETENADT
ncbi:hypothetical protein NDU88_004423 [Pleurodeles waltl]|uniref:Uncharacterized protein n=1 Tax=Pleurodeles waltl TaxID=8319 RepID=A0AAV7LI04_PLEWA|nr:hypothetical protein NDU88_004423 [Pleurodeles waltl]